MVRAFVALELPAEIKDRLMEAQEKLRGCSARLTIVEPALIHITLKFLGEVAEKDLPHLNEALRSVSFRPFPVTVGTVTVNNPKRPHTVWCTVRDNGRGKELFRMVEEVLEPLGFERETRGFTPHATLARVKVPDPSLFSVLRALEGTTYGECMIQGMKLKKSTLMPRGPVYEDLLEVVW
ncbi:MAG: RNA 2',3'-cyclic phosphodiesterase [Methanoregula sp.]|jgi:2'-5' RNA ligase